MADQNTTPRDWEGIIAGIGAALGLLGAAATAVWSFVSGRRKAKADPPEPTPPPSPPPAEVPPEVEEVVEKVDRHHEILKAHVTQLRLLEQSVENLVAEQKSTSGQLQAFRVEVAGSMGTVGAQVAGLERGQQRIEDLLVRHLEAGAR